MNNKLRVIGLGLAAACALGAQGAFAQAQDGGGSDYAAYIGERKAGLAQSLKRRLAGIEARFAEAESFRAKQKGERVAFEKRLEREEESFLDSLTAMKPQERVQAWPAFYLKMSQERARFSTELHQESERFWQARQASWTAGYGAAGKSAPGK